jgi:hypothetical protein
MTLEGMPQLEYEYRAVGPCRQSMPMSFDGSVRVRK